jgi:drug/metabolite transporter (DMT)-like permease
MRGNALTFIKSQNSHFHKYSSSLIGITLVILSGFLLSINGAIGKYLGQDLHPFFITFIRAFIMVLLLLPWIFRKGGGGVKMSRPGLHFINGIFFTLALFGWFWALPRIPLDLNTAVGFTTPIFAVLGAIIFLGEKSEIWRWGALIVGIIGALIIIRPSTYGIPPGVLAAVFSALCFAVTKLLTKVITKSDEPDSIVFSQAFWVTVVAFPVAVYFWETPNLAQFLWIIGLSIVTIMNHFAITWAIKLSDIGMIEPITFTRLIWSAFVGYLIFGDEPNFHTLIGGLIVVSSVVYITRREQKEQKSLRLNHKNP